MIKSVRDAETASYNHSFAVGIPTVTEALSSSSCFNTRNTIGLF